MKIVNRIMDFDDKFIHHLHAVNLHPKIDQCLKVFTRFGDGYAWVFIALYVYLLQPIEVSLSVTQAACFAGAISIITYKILKFKIARQRPYAKSSGIAAKIPPLDEYSFPSGHTMNNLSPGLALAFYLPELIFVAVICPLIWGVLRIYFGVHYISDVVGGALLALCCSALGIMLHKSLPALSL